MLQEAIKAFQGGNFDGADLILRQVLQNDINSVDAVFELGIAYAKADRFMEASAVFCCLQLYKNNDVRIPYNLGLVYSLQGKHQLALAAYDSALKIQSDDVEVLINKGSTYNDIKSYGFALETLDKAIQIRSDIPEAWSNKGIALSKLNLHQEAINAYNEAIKLNPSYAEAWSNKGITLHTLDRYDEAIKSCMQALSIQESAEAKALFAIFLKNLEVKSSDSAFTSLVSRAISEAWGRPGDLLHIAKSIVLLNKDIKGCIARAANLWPAKLSKEELFGGDLLELIAADKLFKTMLENAPLSDMEIEYFLTMTRKIILDQALKEGYASKDSAVLIDVPTESILSFYCAVARQCFNNEYVYKVSKDELASVSTLRENLADCIAKRLPVPVMWVVALASYVPLFSLPHIDDISNMYGVGAVYDLFVQQVKEPREELNLRDSVPKLTKIDGDISRLVQSQYEENPYPRWVKANVTLDPVNIDEYFRATFPTSPIQSLHQTDQLDVLVAGCGTGQHSIEVAHRFKGTKVLAVDLSLSSLGYAKRKSAELRCTNIEYAQADIMELGSINRTFDIIESVGVLHHLADPASGWKVLLGLLRPGGLMYLGFYSELARQEVVVARSYIAQKGFSAKHEEMRRLRQELMNEDNKVKFQQILKFGDFYRMSEFRDLLFHVQEHRYTLPQLKEMLASLDLSFIGFNLSNRVQSQYKSQFPQDIKLTNLDNWNLFEKKNPNTFAGMYQFWVQKNL